MVFLTSRRIRDFDIIKSVTDLATLDFEVKTRNDNTGFVFVLLDDDTNKIYSMFTTSSKIINEGSGSDVTFIQTNDKNERMIYPDAKSFSNLSWIVYEYTQDTLKKIKTSDDVFNSNYVDTSRIQFSYFLG